MSNFKYSSDKINKAIIESELKEVNMLGVHQDLEKLKPIIEELYDNHIFYLTYFLSDAPYHGWDMQSDSIKNMRAITEGITQKVEEIYVLILAGLGKKVDGGNE